MRREEGARVVEVLPGGGIVADGRLVRFPRGPLRVRRDPEPTPAGWAGWLGILRVRVRMAGHPGAARARQVGLAKQALAAARAAKRPDLP